MTDFTYAPPVDQLLTLGKCSVDRDWLDYPALGLSLADVPELIRMAGDMALHTKDLEQPAVWAPTHAMRALGQLRAAIAADPLVDLLPLADELDDDYITEDAPEFLALIGAPAIAPLSTLLDNRSESWRARLAAAESLGRIGQENPDAREECIAVLTRLLREFRKNEDEVNAFLIDSFLIDSLVELDAVEAAPLIQSAFEAGCVDETIRGDWEDVQVDLGLKAKRERPRRYGFFGPFGTRTPETADWSDAPEATQSGDEKRKAKNKAKAKRRQAKKSCRGKSS